VRGGRAREGKRKEGGVPTLIREQTKDTIIIFIGGGGGGGAASTRVPGRREGMSMYGIFISGEILRP